MKNKSIKINLEFTQMLELADKDIKVLSKGIGNMYF